MNKTIRTAGRYTASLLLALATVSATAADYAIDVKGAHAAVNFKFKHLGYSVLAGTFKEFDGSFTWDKSDPSASKINVLIQTASLDSNHAERDKHIRDPRFLNVKEYPTAKFVSTKVVDKGNGKLDIHGDLTLHGTTKPIVLDATTIGEGSDPWGGYRAGFEAYVTLNTKDFGMSTFKPLHQVEMELYIEGIRK